VPNLKLIKAFQPPAKRVDSANPQPGASDAVIPVPLLHNTRKIEKREVGAGRSYRICVEKVVSANVILVHSFLNQAHPQGAAIKSPVLRCAGGDGGNVMDAEKLSAHKENDRWAKFILISS
jgi:hypothetical protein